MARTDRMSAPVDASDFAASERSEAIAPCDADSVEMGVVVVTGLTGATGVPGPVTLAAEVAPQLAAPPPKRPMPFPHTVAGAVTGALAVSALPDVVDPGPAAVVPVGHPEDGSAPIPTV
jgi:hypothetical protein